MQVAASIVIIIVVVTIGFLVSGTVRRWRLERRHAAQREHRKKHKGAAAHKELVRLFPNRDPSERVATVKAIRDVAPGDIIRTYRDSDNSIHVESPTTDPHTLGAYDYRVVTGFTESRRRSSTFVSTVDLDGYGSTAFQIRKDRHIVAYVEQSPPK